MKIKKNQVLYFVITFLSLLTPSFALAQGITIPCDGADCEFGHLMLLAQEIIDFIIIIAVPLAAIIFAYAGFLLVTAAGREGQISKAKGIFTKVLIGLVFILSAWLIVYFITSTLVSDDFFDEDEFTPFGAFNTEVEYSSNLNSELL